MLVPMGTGRHIMTPKKTISIPDLTNKELSIQISLSGLSFCVFNSYENVIESLHDFPFEETVNTPQDLISHLEASFGDVSPDNKPRKLKLIHVNELSAFVPKSLFSESHLSDYLKYNIKILENDFIAYDDIENSNLVNVYVPYSNVNNFFFDQFGVFEYRHHSSILVETLLNLSAKSSDAVMYVHVAKSHFEIVVIKNKKLVLYNSFSYDTPEDFLYYILFTAEQLDLNPELFQLFFLGNIKDSDACYEIAYKYVKNIDFFIGSKTNSTPDEVSNEVKRSAFILQNSF